MRCESNGYRGDVRHRAPVIAQGRIGVMTDLEFSATTVVAVAPADAYAVVSDVTRMGQWSPTCKACWWDDETQAGQVGAYFTGRNETPDRTWETRSQVVAADPGREFAWEVNDGWVRWGFRFEPAGESGAGTELTQYWHFLPKGIEGFGGRFGDDAPRQIELRSAAAKSGIPATLEAIRTSLATA
jgi:hypothetical protein